MPIYKQITEITNIDDLLSSVERDIEEVYFGDKNVFTVWNTYDGTLPAQYSANGSMLADYHIYGSTGGVGDVTAQLFDPNATNTNNGYIAGKYLGYNNEILNPTIPREWAISEYISCSPNLAYVLKTIGNNTYPSICWYDDNYNFLRGTQYDRKTTLTVSSPANAAYVRFSIYRLNTSKNSLTLSPASESYVPYGYEVDMSVRSANKFDPTAYTATGFYLTNLGGYYSGDVWRVSDYIPVVAEGTYLLTSIVGQYPSYCWYNANKEFISGARYMAVSGFTNRLLTAPQNAAFLRFSYVFDPTSASYNEDKCMVIAGSTAPPYQPYYNTTTPIYIGSSPLEEDEYVSFKEQKIYRMSGGVLTPTDPPVPLPAIPTINGTTITDYAGQSAAVPERFYAKYRKEDY